MPKLYSSKHITKILQGNGFFFVSQRGSHQKWRKITTIGVFMVIVPDNKKEIPLGTFKSIIRQSGLTLEDFTKD